MYFNLYLSGSGKERMAKGSLMTCLIMVAITDASCAAGLVWAGGRWSTLFTSDGQVLEGIAKALPWMAGALLPDG